MSYICRITRDHCRKCEYDKPGQREHDCIMLENEEWRNSLGFHLIHNLVINRLHEHSLKPEVEEASPNFKNL